MDTIGFAVSIRAENGWRRYDIDLEMKRKDVLPSRCRLNSSSPWTPIPEDSSFYATHRAGINPALPKTRATPLGQGLHDAFVKFRQFEADHQRRKMGLAVLSEFTLHQPRSEGSRLLVKEAIEKYLLDLKVSDRGKATIDAYRLALVGFKVSCSKQYVDEIGQDDMKAYLVWMQDKKNVGRRGVGQANITFRKRLGFVNTFLRKHGKADLWSTSEWPKIVKKAPDMYDAETIERILKAATAEERVRILFFFYTGCRDMEVATAEYSDINPRTCIFKIQAKPRLGWKPKTYEEREQVLPHSFVKELMERKAKSAHSLIFPTPHSHKVDNNLIEFLQRAAKRAGITERVTLHKIRRTAISRMIDRFGVRQAMAFAGHNNIATTNKYAAREDLTTPNMRKDVEKALAEMVGA